ncbi:MAG: hypothetical protein H5T69_00985 [Chloroflexi bacterium]|nr:hypothetical protein [Chloroflexota bacterium]
MSRIYSHLPKLFLLFVAAFFLASCRPTREAAMPQPTHSPRLVVPQAAASPSPTVVPTTVRPTDTTSPSPAPPTQTPNVQPTAQSAVSPARKNLKLVILHTNDVMGEIDPCG